MSFPTPPGSGGLAAAAHWLEALVQGPLAVTLAVLAVAATGFMMLAGRLPLRRGLAVTVGCFIMFGAPAIAREIMGSAIAVAKPDPALESQTPAESEALSPPTPAELPVTDPYAGASISQ